MRWTRLLMLGGVLLLVVGVLTPSLEYPAGWSEHQGAKSPQCASNLKQLGNALMMYCQDHDERYPPAERWDTLLEAYIKRPSPFLCATDLQTGQRLWEERSSKILSYAINSNLDRRSLAEITSPDKTVALFESSLNQPGARGTEEAICRPPRHLGGNNYGFADGHVQRLRTAPDFGRAATGKLLSTTPKVRAYSIHSVT
jgi:prepilin-type processing-associated H-X9-DG protein